MTVPSAHTSELLSSLPSFLPADVREDLREYAAAGGFTLRATTHPWYPALDAVAGPEEARAASTLLAELRGRDLPLLLDAVPRLADLPGLATPATAGGLADLLALLLRLRETLAVLRPEAYEADLDALAAATATGSWRAEHGTRQSWLRRRSLGLRARRLAATRRVRREDLHGTLTAAAALRGEWEALGADGTRPVLPADTAFLEPAGQAAQAAVAALRELTRLLRPAHPLEALPLTELAGVLDRLAADEGTLYRLPRLHALRESLFAHGLEDLLAELTDRRADAADTDRALAQAASPQATSPQDNPAPVALPEDPQAAPAAELPTPRPEPEAAPTDIDTPEPTEAAPAAEDLETEQHAESDPLPTPAPQDVPQSELDAPADPDVSDTEPTDGVDTTEAEAEEGQEREPAPLPLPTAQDALPSEPEAPSAPAPEALAPEPADDEHAATDAAVEPVAAADEPAAAPAAVPEPPAASASQDAPRPETGASTDAAAKPAKRPARRPHKPDVVPGRPVTAYTAAQLEALVRWIASDSVERTDEELLRAAMKELGFSRLGPRIKEALGAAVTAVRS
jgi:hypothetical protein